MHIVINSYGTTLSREDALFSVETPEGKQLVPPEKVRTISIHKAARITSDAILLAIRANVEIFFINEHGTPEGRVWSVKYGSVSTIRKAQLEFLYSQAAIGWVRELLSRKLDSQIALLLTIQPDRERDLPSFNQIRFAINSIEDYKRKLLAIEGEAIADIAPSLRGWEGAAGKKYFQTIGNLLPPGYRFTSRSRQPATDAFNSLLNYAYGMLYGRVEGALIKAGLDPYLGIFHRDEYNRPALVYDFIEPYRVWMDYVVISLCNSNAFPEDCFEQGRSGQVLLSAMARRILIQSVNDYLGEIIEEGSIARSRAVLLEHDAHKLAQFFQKSVTDVDDR